MAGMNNVMLLLQEQLANGSRSDALRPLAWLIGLLIIALIATYYHDPHWAMQAFISLLLAISVGLYAFSYIFCLLKAPDALRSEKYAIQKLAIEKSAYGDDITGLIVQEEPTNKAAETKLITAENKDTDEG